MSSKIELIGRPAVVEPFYGLRQITRRWKVKGAGSTIAAIEDEVFLPYATADVEYPLALLTAQKIEPISNDQSAESVELVRVYTEFQDDTLVNVGTDNLTKLEDGRTVLTKTFVCLADDAEALAPAIGAVDDGRAVSKVEIQKDGVGAPKKAAGPSDASELSRDDEAAFARRPGEKNVVARLVLLAAALAIVLVGIYFLRR